MNKSSQHVISNLKGGWSVHKSGASKASKVFDKQQDAIDYARELAKKAHSDLYIHREDGTVRKRVRFGKDSFSTINPSK